MALIINLVYLQFIFFGSKIISNNIFLHLFIS